MLLLLLLCWCVLQQSRWFLWPHRGQTGRINWRLSYLGLSMQGGLRLGKAVTKVRPTAACLCQALLGDLRSAKTVSVPFSRSSSSPCPALAKVAHSEAAGIGKWFPGYNTWWFSSCLVLLDELLKALFEVAPLQHFSRLFIHFIVRNTARRADVSHPPCRVPQETESRCLHFLKCVRTIFSLSLPAGLCIFKVLHSRPVRLLRSLHGLPRLRVSSLGTLGSAALLTCPCHLLVELV